MDRRRIYLTPEPHHSLLPPPVPHRTEDKVLPLHCCCDEVAFVHVCEGISHGPCTSSLGASQRTPQCGLGLVTARMDSEEGTRSEGDREGSTSLLSPRSSSIYERVYHHNSSTRQHL